MSKLRGREDLNNISPSILLECALISLGLCVASFIPVSYPELVKSFNKRSSSFSFCLRLESNCEVYRGEFLLGGHTGFSGTLPFRCAFLFCFVLVFQLSSARVHISWFGCFLLALPGSYRILMKTFNTHMTV